MELFLITYPDFFDGEAETLNSLLESYDFTLHLRKPEATEFEYEGLLKSISEKHHNRIILHNAYNLINKYSVLGLHFSPKRRFMKGDNKQIGITSTSCHSLDEIDEIDGQFNYTFISPVFKSISKPEYSPSVFTKDFIKFLKKEHQTRIVALGGIDRNSISIARILGFKHAALLGAVWGSNPSDSPAVISNFNTIASCIR